MQKKESISHIITDTRFRKKSSQKLELCKIELMIFLKCDLQSTYQQYVKTVKKNALSQINHNNYSQAVMQNVFLSQQKQSNQCSNCDTCIFYQIQKKKREKRNC